jgi:TonB-linked SusC/RagA family outer membrane protein
MHLRILKLFIVLLFIGATSHLRAQVAPPSLNINVKNAFLPEIFKIIRQQTGYLFVFDVDLMQQSRKVNIQVKNATLEQVLEICFRDQPFTYTIADQTIVVKGDSSAKKKYALIIPTTTDIHGRVSDSTGSPLVGASVTIWNSRIGAQTDQNGLFQMSEVDSGATIVFSFTGYSQQLVKLKGKTTPNLIVVLGRNQNPLDEVQVIAYGTTTRRLNTGDVSTVTSAAIEKQPVSNPLLALEGRVPGMFIAQSNGLPGTAVKVQIRGQNSIFNGNDPLYIIDGVPYTAQNYLPSLTTVLGNSNTTAGSGFYSGSPLTYINPADIESIDILKDADATAIYGTKGANGVVLVTTKKGKIGQTKVDFNLQTGWGKVADKMKLLNTPQYLEMRNEAFKNDGTTADPNADFDLALWDTTRQTDWQKELIGGTAQFTDAEATVSGGNANTQFLIGGGYNKQTTVFPGDFNDQKGSVHFSINNVSPNQKFRIQFSGLYLVDNNHLCGYDLTQQALQLAPVAPAMYKSDGSINWEENAAGVSTWTNYNPAAMLLVKYNIQTDNLISDAVLSYQILPGLIIKSNFGYTNTQTNEVQILPLAFYSPSQRPFVQRSASFSDNNIHSWIIEPQISYNKDFNFGIFSFLLGTTIQQNTSTGEILNASGFTSDLLLDDINLLLILRLFQPLITFINTMLLSAD